MTITAQTSKTGPYNGNGTTTVFSYTFEVQDEAHLVVTLADASGVETVQVLNTNYTVSGVGNAGGGQITMSIAPAVGYTLTISRNVPITQEVDLENRRSVAPEVLEDAYDKLTQIAQDLSEQVGRTIKTSVSTAAPADLPPTDRAGKFLTFDAAGNPTYTSGTGGDAALRTDLATAGDGSGGDLVGYAATTGATARTTQAKLREQLSVKDFGAVGDGVADDTAAIQAAIAAGGSSEIIHFPNGTYKVTGTLEMPFKCSGNFTIDGDIRWSFKKEVLQQGQLSVTGDVLIDSVWFSRFNHIECQDITFQSSNAVWGSFWNDFGMIRCANFVIDVDQGQSVNQNNYHAVKCSGGIHIRGTATTGVREAHNNMFFSVDTTGANLTAADGSTGHHLLNDSVLNQTNTVLNWYAENSGGRTVKGNWNILADNVDASNLAFEADRENYRLGSRVQGRQSSFLPITQNSLAEGGDWSRLTGVGIPVSLSGASLSNVALASISANAANSPDFSIQGVRSVGDAAFRTIDINYKLTNVARVHATAFVYQEGTPTQTIEILNADGSLNMSGSGRYLSLGNGWYLLRISGTGDTIDRAGGATEGKIRIYTSTASALTASDFRIITSFFVTSEAIAPLPSIKLGQITGFSTTAPSAGTWALGDITWNTSPSAGGTPGWMCVSAGSPGTWKAMANLAI